jgi:hypothetical protein
MSERRTMPKRVQIRKRPGSRCRVRRPLRLLLPIDAQLLLGKHHLRDRRDRRRHGHRAGQVGARVEEQARLLERVRKVGRLGARRLGDRKIVEDVPSALANLCRDDGDEKRDATCETG